MTEDRWRPLAAFALVSLLCALIVAVNLGGSEASGVVRARATGDQITTSKVVFGDVLHPQAGSALGLALGDVGPLSGAVARAAGTGNATSPHTSRARAHKARTHQARAHGARGHRASTAHAGTVAKGKARHAASTSHSTATPSSPAKAVTSHTKHKATVRVRHSWPDRFAAAHHHGSKHRSTRGHDRGHHFGWTHHRGHHRGWGHHGGWGHRHH